MEYIELIVKESLNDIGSYDMWININIIATIHEINYGTSFYNAVTLNNGKKYIINIEHKTSEERQIALQELFEKINHIRQLLWAAQASMPGYHQAKKHFESFALDSEERLDD